MSDFEDEVNMITIEAYLRTFSVAMLLYDHLLTFSDEILYIWTPRWNKSTLLFSLNRYIGLIMNGLTLTFTHWNLRTSGNCVNADTFTQVSLIPVQCLACLIISLRVYALYGRSKRVMWCLLAYFSAGFGLCAWALSRQSLVEAGVAHIKRGLCHVSIDRPTAVRLAISWEALFTYDTTIFILTFHKSWKARHSVVTAKSASFIGVFIRDGAIYFMLIALANLANILTLYFGPYFRGLFGGHSPFTDDTEPPSCAARVWSHVDTDTFRFKIQQFKRHSRVYDTVIEVENPQKVLAIAQITFRLVSGAGFAIE
ncbi:hypothetical protein DL96DRAFT_1716424 [Flagelloscypha sp. PMI_526]|nr:hypothetical protein DL96DRAFT_1716424 [Flagelloscypha sp. PMI_526]